MENLKTFASLNVFDKISLLRQFSSDTILRAELFYDILEECGALKLNYCEYATTHPIDCRQELLRCLQWIMTPAAPLNYISPDVLTNAVAGHHIHESLTVEDFELLYGAERLKAEDIQHNILCIKINRRYHHDMTPKELYDAVRGIWRASMNTIKGKHIEYVFGVYNQLVVAVYKPDEWHYVYERIDAPHLDELDADGFEKVKNQVYFICSDYEQMDENQQFYLLKSIADLKVNQSAQNPITYLLRSGKN